MEDLGEFLSCLLDGLVQGGLVYSAGVCLASVGGQIYSPCFPHRGSK